MELSPGVARVRSTKLRRSSLNCLLEYHHLRRPPSFPLLSNSLQLVKERPFETLSFKTRVVRKSLRSLSDGACGLGHGKGFISILRLSPEDRGEKGKARVLISIVLISHTLRLPLPFPSS